MKIIALLFLAMGLLVLVMACSRRQSKEIPPLNYDEMIALDAEDLGEGGIGAAYTNAVVPVLKQNVDSPAEVVERFDLEAPAYQVSALGKSYTIFSPEMDVSQGRNWGNATFALFDMVNRQLQESPYRFYAINGGNDLGGLFLTRETYEHAIQALARKQDWPYLPTREPPWYGQPHEK